MIPDHEIDELLSGDRLSGRQYDEILKRVLSHERVGTRRVWAVAGGSIGCLAAIGLWLVFAGSSTPYMAAKGNSSQDGRGAFGLGCPSTSRATCRRGETLMFTVNAAVTSGFLGAYSERIGDPSSGRIWYFPNSSGVAPVVEPGSRTVVLSEGVRIGPEHRPGRYRVTIWTSPRPITATDANSVAHTVAKRSALELEVLP